MRQCYFWVFLVVLIVLFSGLMVLFPGAHAMAAQPHTLRQLDTPTPTPDVSETLQTAQQADSNAQTILNFINILLGVIPLFIALTLAVLGAIGFRSVQSFQKDAREQIDIIKNLKDEAQQKTKAIIDTQTAIVYLALGDRLSNQIDTRQGIEAYKKAGSLLQDDPQISFVQGRIYSGAGYYKEAIQSFEAALAAQSSYPEAEMELGLAYRRRGEYQKSPNAHADRESDF